MERGCNGVTVCVEWGIDGVTTVSQLKGAVTGTNKKFMNHPIQESTEFKLFSHHRAGYMSSIQSIFRSLEMSVVPNLLKVMTLISIQSIPELAEDHSLWQSLCKAQYPSLPTGRDH